MNKIQILESFLLLTIIFDEKYRKKWEKSGLVNLKIYRKKLYDIVKV